MPCVYSVATVVDGHIVSQKVGYTGTPWIIRLTQYITHNPHTEILETVEVYRKTKRQLETAIHHELKAKGYEFITKYGKRTEWVHITDGQAISLETLNACKGRKIYKVE